MITRKDIEKLQALRSVADKLHETLDFIFEQATEISGEEDYTFDYIHNKAYLSSLLYKLNPESTKDVHTEHCCVIHGCKYMNENCPVDTLQKVQSFPCEGCNENL